MHKFFLKKIPCFQRGQTQREPNVDNRSYILFNTGSSTRPTAQMGFLAVWR